MSDVKAGTTSVCFWINVSPKDKAFFVSTRCWTEGGSCFYINSTQVRGTENRQGGQRQIIIQPSLLHPCISMPQREQLQNSNKEKLRNFKQCNNVRWLQHVAFQPALA